MCHWFMLHLRAQNGIWVKFYHFWPKKDGEKWSRKNIFEIPPCAKPFSENLFYFIERWIFAETSKFSNKNDLLCVRRDLKNQLCGGCRCDKWNFKPKIPPIFNFYLVNDGWVSRILCVKISSKNLMLADQSES